jgi:DNA-binding NtrC family response regulator
VRAIISLVVETPAVLDVLRMGLARNGYTAQEWSPCLRAEVPGDCSQCFPQDARPDLMVIEVLLPRCCSGIQVAEKALQRWPEVKILLTSATPVSGWPFPVQRAFRALPEGSVAFLAKPFITSQFFEAIDALRQRKQP